VRRAIELRELKRENLLLKQNMLAEGPLHAEAFAEIVTQSRTMIAIFQYVEAIARSTQPVLITGETGVGKELMARAIHTLSDRKGSFVSINVAGLDDEMFADSLFGHKRGAFTGAATARKGLVEQASGGTLFLDEIGDLAVSSQVKLLRLLQEREYFPLGADVPRRAEARTICATNQDLAAFMQAGRFRKDLYYRLRTHHIHIPPLRERMDDLPLLVDSFLREAADQLGKKKPTPPRELITLLQTHSFPGNIRELKAMVFDAVSKHESRILSRESFQKAIYPNGGPCLSAPSEEATSEVPSLRFPEKLPTLRDATQMLVAEALRRANGNQTIAARLLGISQQALSKRLSREE
jgi:DNA-binding NtrC family response regulator